MKLSEKSMKSKVPYERKEFLNIDSQVLEHCGKNSGRHVFSGMHGHDAADVCFWIDDLMVRAFYGNESATVSQEIFQEVLGRYYRYFRHL